MDWEPWIHFIHIGSAIIWVGGGVMVSVLGVRARQSGDLARIGDFARTLSYVGLHLFMPAVITVLLSGVALVLISSEWDFAQIWVLLALAAFVVAFLIGVVFLSRSAIQTDKAANDAHDLDRARASLTSWLTGYAVVLVVLGFAVWDMIFKPGL